VKTQLNIDIPEEKDCRFLTIVDRSVYNPDIPIEETTLQITPPGFNYPISFYYEPHKSITFNSNLLKLTNTSGDYSNLPDGIYIIKQQMCPVDKLFAEYYYMRTCNIRSCYYDKFCKLTSICDLDSKEYKELKASLDKIDHYIKAAKYSASHCGDIQKAQDFLKQAKKLIDKISSNCNC